MSLRDTINEKKSLFTGVAIGIVVLAIGLIVWQTTGTVAYDKQDEAFYTDDGGKTHFKADIKKVSPWDHDGKQAYRCDVFKVGSGDPFVGIIYRHNKFGKDEMEKYIATNPKDPGGESRKAFEHLGLEMRLAKSEKGPWILVGDSSADRMINAVKGPNGEAATQVMPD